jgi:hypothetical protein
MTDEPLVLITAEQYKAKQDEEQDIVRRIAADQQRLADVRDWLSTVARLVPKAQPRLPLAPRAQIKTTFRSAATVDGDNLTLAIENLANASDAPLPKAELKTILAEQGFSAERLANYFYTAIHRLKAKDRITVQPDGSVWRAPAKNSGAGGES